MQRILERLVFGSGLTFYMVWEDPAIDAEALAVTGDDVVVSIASAGDNVLNLALAGPKKIYAVDLNPAQIHLLRLKIAAAQHLDYAAFWHLFSLQPAPHAGRIYRHALREHLESDTVAFWDNNHNLNMLRHGLGRAGVFGLATRLLRGYLRLVCGTPSLERLFRFDSLPEQAAFYGNHIHARCWNPATRWLIQRMPLLLLFGAHPQEAARIRGEDYGQYLAQNIARVFTTVPARDNFLWQAAALGRYVVPPPYLRSKNFARLKAATERIDTRICRVEDLLSELPAGSVTRANLLNAVDWLSAEETATWWSQLQRVAAPGARVLFRTVDPAYEIPAAVLCRWRDATDPEWAARERVGVYAGVYLFEHRPNS
jgi:S-adenosylmethionine-diacylglycerol 3-amino-3-carboxypropyl transferase